MKEKKRTWAAMTVLFLLCLGQFAPNYAQYQLAPLAPKLMQTFGLSAAQYSSVFSAPMIPAIFLSLAAGVLVDKLDIRRTIGTAMAVTAAGLCWRVWSDSYPTLFFSMLLSGVGICFLNANSAKIIGNNFPPEKVEGMMGVVLAASTLGMTVGTGTTALLPGIQSAYLIAAVLIVTAVVLWWLLIPDEKKPDSKTAADTPAIRDGLRVVLKEPAVWIAGLCLLLILGCNVLISSRLPEALARREIGSVQAGYYTAAVTLGSLLGCLAAPRLAAGMRSAKLLMAILAAAAAGGASFAWTLPRGAILGMGLCATGIAMGGMMPLLMSLPVQLPNIGPTYAGTAGGVTSTLQLLGAVVVPTYVAVPIAGDNMSRLFLVGGACMALVFALVLALPALRRTSQEILLP